MRLWLAFFLLSSCGKPPGNDGGLPDLSPPVGGNTCPGLAVAPSSPIAYGLAELERALVEAKVFASVCLITHEAWNGTLAIDSRPESFAIVPAASGGATIVGRDPTGALYGALELAERLRLDGASALTLATPLFGTPAVPIRGANLFLVLPEAGETSWWFRDPVFWREYLDLLARARINFLDLHGMYHGSQTTFPNALLYFAKSQSFPSVGAPSGERDLNLAALHQIIALAGERGISVGLMSYRSDESLDGQTVPERQRLTPTQLETYTLEAATDLAQRLPKLARLGFRIGESGHDAKWYVGTFVAGVKQAGTGVRIYTRTWLSSRQSVMAIVKAAGEVILEAKYNGEHLGLPYPIQGGAFVEEGWTVYGYENYLDPPNRPLPYALIFQVRAGGTHRIFRQAGLERTRRAVALTTLGGVQGFTLEAPHAYFPQRDYYHFPQDQFSNWTFRRDEPMYLQWGRLGYDPTTPERVFRSALAARLGTDALWSAVQAASEIVPWIQSAHTCGPDHRDYAPELEVGGHVAYWASGKNAAAVAHSCAPYSHGGPIYHGPFDSFAIASPLETATDWTSGHGTSRISSLEAAERVLTAAATARQAALVSTIPQNAEAIDVQRECIALADLGEHFAHKERSATLLAVYQQTGDAAYLAATRSEIAAAHQAWQKLASDTAYIVPFREMLRMAPLGLPLFHWQKELDRLQDDDSSIDAVEAFIKAHPPLWSGTLPAPSDWLATQRPPGPGLQSLSFNPPQGSSSSWKVTALFQQPVPPGTTVRFLWKPLSALADWKTIPATGNGTQWSTLISGGGAGAQLAVEGVGGRGIGWRYPEVLQETPYRTLLP